MKLIIDIPDSAYDFLSQTVDAIANGTPLEKHDEEIIKETVASIWGKPPYIELLDKIRAELHATAEMHEDDVYYLREEWIDEIIDKYRKGQTDADSD